MKYDFYSRNRDLHFSINDEKEFKRFCHHLKIRGDDELERNVKKIISKFKKENFVFVSKYYTDWICDEFDGYWDCCYVIQDIDDYISKKLSSKDGLGTQELERELVDIVNLLRFHNFLKSFNEGFIICREDQSEIVLRNLSNNEKLIDTYFKDIPENQVQHSN